MGTDLLIVAIGVVPNESDYNDGQFIDVNTKLQHLSYPNVYAAGDCCHVCVEKEHNLDSDIVVGNWFQMRLWSQVSLLVLCCIVLILLYFVFTWQIHLCFRLALWVYMRHIVCWEWKTIIV